jgi:hypothetical protein
MTNIIERPCGIGKLNKGDKYIANVLYNLMVILKPIKVGELRGHEEITGSFKINVGDVGNNIDIDNCILELEDGRVLGVNATCEDVKAKTFSIFVNDTSKFIINK